MTARNIGRAIKAEEHAAWTVEGRLFMIESTTMTEALIAMSFASRPASRINVFTILGMLKDDFFGAVRTFLRRLTSSTRARLVIWQMLHERSQTEPIPVCPVAGRSNKTCYLFKEHVYRLNRDGYSAEEIKLLIMEAEHREARKLDRLKKKFDGEICEPKRETIPEEVRIEVWRRDDGTCVKCGCRERLEYDHIIPVSRGGGNTARNIELLCETCNRQKSNHIR